MGLSKQANWNGLPFTPPGDLPDPGIKSMSPVFPAFQTDSLQLQHLGTPFFFNLFIYFNWRLITLQYCSGFRQTLT